MKKSPLAWESSDSFQALAKAKMNGDQGVETQAKRVRRWDQFNGYVKRC